MKKKFILYVAVPGTYDAALTTLHLIPMKLEEKTYKKDLRAVKKQLKLSNVIVEATEYVLRNLELEHIFVTPKVNIDNIWFYRDKFELPAFTRYMYPILVSKLNKIMNGNVIKKIELVKEMLLEEYIEGIDL